MFSHQALKFTCNLFKYWYLPWFVVRRTDSVYEPKRNFISRKHKFCQLRVEITSFDKKFSRRTQSTLAQKETIDSQDDYRIQNTSRRRIPVHFLTFSSQRFPDTRICSGISLRTNNPDPNSNPNPNPNPDPNLNPNIPPTQALVCNPVIKFIFRWIRGYAVNFTVALVSMTADDFLTN